MELYKSLSDSPAYHCDLENYFLTGHPEKDLLLFYINRPSVIVGRNQEVDNAYCKAFGIEIIRRLSGGGTVYHDGGNINYAFIVSKSAESVLDMDFTVPIVKALVSLDIEGYSWYSQRAVGWRQ